MPKTLLAVDDSATMRKCLEITFGSDDFNVITAESRDEALGKLGEKPNVVVIDGGEDWGYALAKDVRAKEPAATIVMLSSRFAPYDAAKAKEAGCDENIEKPFDTQQAIDKVKKAVASRESGAPAVAAAPAAAAKPAPAAVAAAPAAARPAAAAPAAAKPAAAAPAPAKAAMPAVAAGMNGKHMAAKLADLGLNQNQVDAVMSLSRQVIESVVWEVVPTLAATMIREEIARLTKD